MIVRSPDLMRHLAGVLPVRKGLQEVGDQQVRDLKAPVVILLPKGQAPVRTGFHKAGEEYIPGQRFPIPRDQNH